MTKLRAVLISLFSLSLLALTAVTTNYVPGDPKVFLAEDAALGASQGIFEMKYLESARLYEESLPKLSGDEFHRWMYGRALAHLGLWENAAVEFQMAAGSKELKTAAVVASSRLRALSDGSAVDENEVLEWKVLESHFAQNRGIGDIALIDDGTIVTAHPMGGFITFWSASGREEKVVRTGGRPVSLAADNDGVWVADLSGNRLYRVGKDRGIQRTIDLNAHNVFGVRDVAVDGEGFLWIADFGNARVIRLSPAGDPVTRMGEGELTAPTAVLSQGKNVLVGEEGRAHIRLFDRNGRHLRDYRHPELASVRDLVSANGSVFVQDREGKIFRIIDEQLEGPLLDAGSPLITAPFGFTVDKWRNIWWGDGESLKMAQKLPASKKYHMVEVLRTTLDQEATSHGVVHLTVSVMTRDGEAVRGLDDKSFRLIMDDSQIVPLRVRNLSEELKGRRIMVVREASREVEEESDWMTAVWGAFIEELTPEDKTAVLTMSDTYQLSRSFVSSTALVREALNDKYPLTPSIDLKSFAAMEYAVRTLAPVDFGRAIIWVTSGASIRDEEMRILRRMAVINQVPIFIIHVSQQNEASLLRLANETGGDYYRLFSRSSIDDFFGKLDTVGADRYRLSAAIPLPGPLDRGSWQNLLVESYYLDEIAYDRSGFHAP